MAVNWPDNPLEGDIHVEQGVTWQYVNGAWAIGQPRTGTDIVDDDVTEGWQVVGDVLIQWGTEVSSGGSAPNWSGTFHQPFKTVPAMSAMCISHGNVVISISEDGGGSISETGWAGFIQTPTAGGASGRTAWWIAVGEAPDALKKPKTVQTIGGASIQEVHNADGSGFRITGNTLECWGSISGGTVTSVAFPKAFMRPPLLTWGSESTGPGEAAIVSGVSVMDTITTTGFDGFVRYTSPGAGGGIGGDDTASWHAIGEWDGVNTARVDIPDPIELMNDPDITGPGTWNLSSPQFSYVSNGEYIQAAIAAGAQFAQNTLLKPLEVGKSYRMTIVTSEKTGNNNFEVRFGDNDEQRPFNITGGLTEETEHVIDFVSEVNSARCQLGIGNFAGCRVLSLSVLEMP